MLRLTFLILLSTYLQVRLNSAQSVDNQDKIGGISWLYLDRDDFRKFGFKRDCLEPKPGVVRVSLGRSVETFVQLVEKLEQHPSYSSKNDPVTIARILLRSFRFDGVNWKKLNTSVGKPPTINLYPGQEHLLKAAGKVFGQPPIGVDRFPRNVFTEAELCLLLEMLTHTFVARNISENPLKSVVEELGTVGVRGLPSQSLSLGRVLAGALAGLKQLPMTTVGKLITDESVRALAAANNHSERLIDPIAAVTIGDVCGLAGRELSVGDLLKDFQFGLTGKWASKSCSRTFQLDKIDESVLNSVDPIFATLADIRGGIDGYLIGHQMKKQDKIQMKLSSILRKYYSVDGISFQTGSRQSFCARNLDLKSTAFGVNSLVDNINSFHLYFNYEVSRSRPDSDDSPILNQMSAFEQAKQVETSSLVCPNPGGGPDYFAVCETPSDVVFVIDNEISRLPISKLVVNDILASVPELSSVSGTASVFGALKAPFPYQNVDGFRNYLGPSADPNNYGLMPIAFNETSSGCAGCLIEQLPTVPPPVEAQLLYLTYLNETLTHYKQWTPRIEFPGLPGLTVVLIDGGALKVQANDQTEVKKMVDVLRTRHSEISFIAVTNNIFLFDELLKLREGEQQQQTNRFQLPTSGSNQFDQAVEVARSICETPATLRYATCRQRPSRRDDSPFVGFVSPSRRQSWMMVSQWFFSSSDVKFFVRPTSGRVKACFGRQPRPTSDCRESQFDDILYHVPFPCDGQPTNSCKPIYLSVWGVSEATAPCLEVGCRNPSQVRFEVRHEGVFCDGSIPPQPTRPPGGGGSSPATHRVTYLVAVLLSFFKVIFI